MPRYHLAHRTEVVVHLDVEADNPEEATRLAEPQLHERLRNLHPRLEAALAHDSDAEVEEDWYLVRVDRIDNGRAIPILGETRGRTHP